MLSKEPANISKRDSWSGRFEFLMSCISLSVGLGNIWRFPFTAYENGGGAFLIPYIIVLFIIGKPMYYLEAILGQFSSKSSIRIWSICPIFAGIGVGQAYASIAVLTYYSALIAIALFYLVASFQSVLPWSYCREEWQGFCIDSVTSLNISEVGLKTQSSSELYFQKIVLNELEDISGGIGLPNWKLALALLASWLITFVVVIKGIKSLGKVSYFLAIFPYIMLLSLLIRAVTLEGAIDGIIFLLKPNWSELLNVKVWKEAVVQCFFSLTVSMGPIITFSSYNKFDHNVHRDAMIVTTLDTFTSLLAGITIFGILGNLAHNLQVNNIDEVVRSGTGLAFISYPDAIAKLNTLPQLFSVLFFVMLSVLGIGSVVALQTTVVTIICDQFEIPTAKFWKVSLVVSICGFLCGLVYVTPGGQWILNLVDTYAGTYVLFFLACLEAVGIFWIYGINNFCDDVEFMTRRKVSLYFRICWQFLTPTLMMAILIYSLVEIRGLYYAGSQYPLEADIAGWVVLTVGVIQFPLWAIWLCALNYKKGIKHTIFSISRCNSKWGPASTETKIKWIIFKEELKKQRNALK